MAARIRRSIAVTAAVAAAISTQMMVTITARADIPARATGLVRFPREFAPQEGLLKPAERPFREELCLNGSWQFQPVTLPAEFRPGSGVAPILSPPTDTGWEKTPVRIPSPWNVNGFPDWEGLGGDFNTYPSYPESWKNVSMGWLRRSFTPPTAWKDRRLVLHFQAVAGSTQVIINGRPVATHADNFLPFTVDVTDAVRYGAANTLLVGVRKASLSDVPGKYGRRTYQGGSMWGQHIVGIWQDVFLEARPAVHIANVFVKPSVDRDILEAEVTLRNDTRRAATVRLSGEALPWTSQAGKDTLSAPVPRGILGSQAALRIGAVSATVPAGGSTTVTLTRKAEGRLKLWSPENPNLYGLVCRLRNGKGAVSDVKQTRFGWRQVTFRGSRVILNGKPLIIKGDSWHFMGIPQMTRRYVWAWYRTLRDANLNAVRLHAQPYPEFYLDMADEMGILVLDETAVWASDGGPKMDAPAFWKNTETHLHNLILRDRNHPSVFGWSVSNEMMAVARNVFHTPQEQQDTLIREYAVWTDICRRTDPTRPWISADGEDDGNGTLPTYVVHYAGNEAMDRAARSDKPWGVGEAGPAYYGTPEQIAEMSGNSRSYLSFGDRMAGVAAVSYRNLMDQRTRGASFRSVFNLVWYGLKPLELGMTDTTRPPALTDGVTFPPFVEGKPGVQPERLGPYCTTLNPGYDPRLPLYVAWPLFTAIHNAQADPVQKFPTAFPPVPTPPKRGPGTVKQVSVLSDPGSTLFQSLTDQGVNVAAETAEDAASPVVLFVDGAQPPGIAAKSVMETVLSKGGTVFVWGADTSTLQRLNNLLPEPLELTTRTATSLTFGVPDPLTVGITAASLYFSELSPAVILTTGLAGPLVSSRTTLLAANNTDWLRWNRQPETTKTAMILRSERETKPPGAALVSRSVGTGRLILCTLPAAPQTSQAAALNRTLLANLGIVLGDGVAQRNVLNGSGTVMRALAVGRLPFASAAEAVAAAPVAPNSGASITVGAAAAGRPWTPVVTGAEGAFDLQPMQSVSAPKIAVLYLSFWLYSPKALDRLLLDPHLPNLDLAVTGASGAQVWINGKPVPMREETLSNDALSLPLAQGWTHVLVKVVQAAGETRRPLALRLRSSQPDYLRQLRGAQERP